MNIVNHFIAAANKYPEAVAIVHKNQSLTYDQLHTKVRENGAAMVLQGIKPGDNVMLMIPFSIELYIKILALFYIGARVVLVDAIKDRERVVNAHLRAECKAIVSAPMIYVLRYFFFSKELWNQFMQVKPLKTTTLKPFLIDEADTALITFTTGSTGDPKAANRTHQFLDIQLETLIEEMKIKVGDTHISSLPVVLMCNLAVGATSVIPPKDNWMERKHWKFLRESWAPTVVSASPFHVDYFNKNLKTELYQKVFVGGATILPHFAKELATKVVEDKITFVYGSTEAEPISSLTAVDYLSQLNESEAGVPVGNPHEKLTILIAKVEDGKIQEMEAGAVGEILVAGDHVLENYYKDTAAFAKNKINYNGKIWHRTGDAGALKEKQLFFYGRLKYIWFEHNLLCSPTCFEKWLSIALGESNATLLRINNKNYIFYTAEKKKNLELALAASPHKIDEWIAVKQLPRDSRHQSRIDYEKLIQFVNNK